MKLSLNWLSDYIDIPTADEKALKELVNTLTLSTCEVEEVTNVYEHLDNVIAVEIQECKNHPEADKLQICKIFDGKEHHDIICGAANAKPGIIVPFAPPGTRLPLENGEFLEISKRKIRGIESSGMLCSAGEIGLDKIVGTTDGLLVLNNIPDISIKVGESLAKCFPLKDTVIEIDNKSITHRPDLWCHFGFAREVAAATGKTIKFDPLIPERKNTTKKDQKPHKSGNRPVKRIEIEDGAAHAYYGLHLDNVRIGESPLWLKARLTAIGQKPINNVVDVSNYLMFETGQPNHAFDASVMKSDTVSVILNNGRRIKEFTTLDEQSLSLPEEAILIIDGKVSEQGKVTAKSSEFQNNSAVALGGIMGGLNSAVQPETEALFVESATFPRENIRKTLSAVSLRTDSAIRFEKGQDPAKAEPALHRFVELLSETCPDLIAGKVSGSSPQKAKQSQIELTLSFLQSRLGFTIGKKEAIKTLEKLNFSVAESATKGGQVQFKITAPTYRSQYDITIPEDIVEEIGRMYGYDNIVPVPPVSAIDTVTVNEMRLFERRIKSFMVQRFGFYETLNYSFTTEADNQISGEKGLALKNPVGDKKYMRLSQLPGLIRQAVTNQHRFPDFGLFELGKIYPPNKSDKNGLPEERYILNAIYMPDLEHKGEDPIFSEFLKFRNGLESLLSIFIGDFNMILHGQTGSNKADPFAHPGCAVAFYANDKKIGHVARLHPEQENHFDIRRTLFYVELEFDELFHLHEEFRRRKDYRPPDNHPDSHFELTVVMNEKETTARPIQIIDDLKLRHIEAVELLTIYRGTPLPEDKKSVSYRVTARSKDHTLSGEELQSTLDKIIAAMDSAGFPLR